jgi:hypothetical protein
VAATTETVPRSLDDRAPSGTGRARVQESVSRGARWAAPAFGVYLGIRLLSVLTWIPLAHRQDSDPFVMLKLWDGQGYEDVARRGYLPIVVSPDGNSYNSAAFFPMYPHLMRGISDLTGASPGTVGLVISWIASLVGVAGIYLLALRLRDKRTALLTVALFGIAPSAAWEWALYADMLFIALAVWTLISVLERRWVIAGLLCTAAGLTRPTAVALIGALGLAALVAVIRREDGWRPWAGAAIAPLGFLSYMAWLWKDYGRWDAYFVIQRGWAAEFDWGKGTFDFLKSELIAGGGQNIGDFTPSFFMTAFSLAASALLILLLLLNARTDRTPLVVLAYTAAGVFLTLGSNQLMTSKPRELLAFFPLLLPMAGLLAKARTRSLVVVFAALGLAAGWYAWYIPALALPWPP